MNDGVMASGVLSELWNELFMGITRIHNDGMEFLEKDIKLVPDAC